MLPDIPFLRINPSRIQGDLNSFAKFTDPEKPYTRRAFTPLYQQARVWLRSRMVDAGLETRVDAAGNLIGRIVGQMNSKSVLMMGSHTDTVERGGRFDGIVGVVGALEVARCLQESGVHLQRSLEIVDFVCEEPTIVNLSPLGSRTMAGDVTPDMIAAASAPSGQSLGLAIADLGGQVDQLGKARRNPGDIAAFLELHIEQGSVLERAGLEVGVVTVVAGPCRGSVRITGVADHAGATSMTERRDALAGASEFVLEVERIVSTPDLIQESVGTVGSLTVSPNMVNVIPGQVDMKVEVRSTSVPALEWAREAIETSLYSIGERRRLTTQILWEHLESPVPVAPQIQELFNQACDDLAVPHMGLPSRASHDAARLAPITPAGIVFIPCLEGRSHCPEEWADLNHIVTGTQVLGRALLLLDRRLS